MKSILDEKQKKEIELQKKQLANNKGSIEKEISKYGNSVLLRKFKTSNEPEIKKLLEIEITNRGGEAKLNELIIENYNKEVSKYSNAKLLNVNNNSNEYLNDKFQDIVKEEMLKRGGIIKLEEIVNKEKKEQELVSLDKEMKAKEPLACIIGSIILTIVVMIIAFIAKDSFASWEGIGSGWFGFVITMFLLFVSSYISRLVLLPMYRRDPIIFIVGGIVVTAGGIFILLLIAYLIVLFSEWIYYSYINKEMGKRISKMRTELSAELITENE